jgi:hypothetical protein
MPQATRLAARFYPGERLIFFVLGCIAVRGAGKFAKFVAVPKEHHTTET